WIHHVIKSVAPSDVRGEGRAVQEPRPSHPHPCARAALRRRGTHRQRTAAAHGIRSLPPVVSPRGPPPEPGGHLPAPRKSRVLPSDDPGDRRSPRLGTALPHRGRAREAFRPRRDLSARPAQLRRYLPTTKEVNEDLAVFS